MKKILLYNFILVFALITQAQVQDLRIDLEPCTFEENTNITIFIDGASVDESLWNITDNSLYLWAWSFDSSDQNIQDAPSNGAWTNSNEANKFNYDNTSDTYTFSFVPSTFYQRTNIGRIGFLIKAKSGDGDKKTPDYLFEMGETQFILNVTSPLQPDNVINSGDSLTIEASNSCGNADYVLRANGVIIDSRNAVSSYSYTVSNIVTTTAFTLEVTYEGVTQRVSGSALINPGTVNEALALNLVEGINYNPSDATKATLVVDAPFKDYVYVVGSFNNYSPSSSYVMKKDPTTSKFWITLENLTPGQIETYQYWIVDESPITNSPGLVKTADPYSTLVLSPFDDPFIPESSYPNLPAYPEGQEREVTVLQTGQTPYDWQVTNFQKPKIEDLIVYEVLVRDFDSGRNYQDLIDKIDYFKNLNINAIHLMPVMEFEGNESWGYNTAFHMALDKFYGTEDKLKEFIDLCHQNGIAVILDVVLNHAFGRNPFARMWMDDPDGDGWGGPSSESPYFNQFPTHAFNVGNDFNHQQERVQTYVKSVIRHWIEDFNIDGFRWDLTKGFTQNCGNGTFDGDFGCTQNYQQDRIDVLREYADYSWSLDDSHYVIFEHLGSDAEEQQWANYRIDEGKGIMMWGKMTDEYNELVKGFASNGNIDRMGHTSRGFAGKRLLGYAESHDEERIMAKTLREANTAIASHNPRELDVALSRMSAMGAASVMIPGPKMIWHFGALGMDNSIFMCNNGSINFPNFDDDGQGDCKLDTKPQPQWAENWLSDPNRNKIYNDWSRLHALKINEDVFEGDYAISPDRSNVRQRIYVFDNGLPNTELKNVVILCNFSIANLGIRGDFPFAGTWYDLMDNTGSTSINVTDLSAEIQIPAGQFRIFGNQPAQALSIDDNTFTNFKLYPNPAQTSFRVSSAISSLEIYDITGKMVKSFVGNFTNSDTFNISNLNTGIYIVKASNNNGQSSTSKLVKL